MMSVYQIIDQREDCRRRGGSAVLLLIIFVIAVIIITIIITFLQKNWSREEVFNPLSPNIHKQILHTDLNTFPYRISWENLFKDQSIFPEVIISFILLTFSLDYVSIVWGENRYWSLLGLKVAP